VQGDSGYQGILALHKNSETPKKKVRRKELTDEEKNENKRISEKDKMPADKFIPMLVDIIPEYFQS